ncbi:hypothetical protein AAF712_004605 [Marasmius tenuissimus]|uniref:F-box domain-containing protein n=1 Tax=Marasmius tenuissimus TaxID=585030 RepID=A0ABR3A2M9_9AGAR
MSSTQISQLNKTELQEKGEILDGLILQLESDLAQARIDREMVRRSLNAIVNSHAAWSKLPNEILAKVFQHCVDADTGGHALSGWAAPWMLARICQRWREVVVSTPMLWNIIRIRTKHNCHNPLKMVEIWIERSRPLLISCLVIFDGCHADDETQFETAIFHLLLHSYARWRHLHIRFIGGPLRRPDRADLYYALLVNSHHLPLLESIHIHINALDTHLDAQRKFEWTAPKLWDASIRVAVEPLPLTLPSPSSWSQLQALEWTTEGPPYEFLKAISTLPHLQILSISIALAQTHIEQWESPPSMVILSTLHRLQLDDYANRIGQIISFLYIPNLTDLSILGTSSDGDRNTLHLIADLQRRSSCRLERLNVPCRTLDIPDLMNSAARLPTIQELHLLFPHEDCGADAIRGLLKIDIFPELRALHLVINPTPLMTTFLQNVVEVVHARRQRILNRQMTCLSLLSIDTIKYHGPPKPSPQANTRPFQQLLELQAEGLQLLGRIVDGRWCSPHPESILWDLEQHERRRARFGYSDWLVNEWGD